MMIDNWFIKKRKEFNLFCVHHHHHHHHEHHQHQLVALVERYSVRARAQHSWRRAKGTNGKWQMAATS